MKPLRKVMESTEGRRLSAFFCIQSPLTEYIAKRHEQGDVLANISPEAIWINEDTGEVQFQSQTDIDRLLPYISPEQTGRLGWSVDQRSDLYSLGVLFYELLTGKLPFQAQDALGWTYAHLSSAPKPPHLINSEIPEILSRVVMKLLAKSPEERYQTIAALRADLARCRLEWERRGAINPFPLGQSDLPQRLLKHDKLVGRNQAFAVLTRAYLDARRGRPQAVFVSGIPGVGKTALVNAFQKRELATKPKNYFLYGKSLPIVGDMPYSSILQAITGLIQQILTHKKEADYWRPRLREVLEDAGGILTEMIPELASLTGPFPATAPLPPRESQLRFLRTFSKLINVFAAQHCPLVFFLDDLQWMDEASLELLEHLAGTTAGFLLWIFAYRSGEEGAAERTSRLMKALADGGASVHHIHIEPLNLSQTRKLISGILGQRQGIEALASDVFRRSGGVPLYIRQVLHGLYSEGSLHFSLDQMTWQYVGADERKIPWEEDMIDLLLARVKGLPAHTAAIVKYAACLGRRFPLPILAAVSGWPSEALVLDLEPAVTAGILLKGDDNRPGSCYEFVHDRVVEALYSLLPEREKKKIHLQAGWAMLEQQGLTFMDAGLFAAVDHLNSALDLITDADQRLQLAQYNLEAAKKARASVAFKAALGYLQVGIELLPQDCWDTHYELSFELYSHYYWCKFLLDGFQSAEQIFQLIEGHARTVEEKVELYVDRASLATAYYTDEEAVRSGLAALQLLGLQIPMRPSEEELTQELAATRGLLADKAIDFLLHLPPMTDPWALQTIGVLGKLIPPATVFDPGLFVYVVLQMVKLSLQYGTTALSALAYAGYSFLCVTQLRDFTAGISFQKLAMDLAARHEGSVRYMVDYFVATYLNHWHRPLRESFRYGKRAYRLAHEHGDILFAGAIHVEMVQMRFVLGDSLDDLEQQNKAAQAAVAQYGIGDLLDILQTTDQYIANLRGQTADPLTFTGNGYDEQVVAERMLATESTIIVPFYYLMKIRSLYLQGAAKEAWELVMRVHPERGTMAGKVSLPEFDYWTCLVAAAVIPTLPKSAAQQARKLLNQGFKHLQQWSQACRDNFYHKLCLASAERYRLQGSKMKAMANYEEAIGLALSHGYKLDAALACELAAAFYLERDFAQNAKIHLDCACRLYEEYGATAKANRLRATYREILGSPSTSQPVQPPHDREVASRVVEKAELIAFKEAFASLASQGDLGELINRLMGIILKSAGAQRGFLLAVRDDDITVIAGRDQGLPPDEAPGASPRGFSQAIVRYALGTNKPVLVPDAREDLLFAKDGYVRSFHPKSVLCLPLTWNDQRGVLYLENNLAANAFAADLIEPVERFASQALMVYQASLGPAANKIAAAREANVVFTNREAKILSLIAAGLSNIEIAARLHIAEGTVKWYTHRLFNKLGVESRTQAVVRAGELGLLALE